MSLWKKPKYLLEIKCLLMEQAISIRNALSCILPIVHIEKSVMGVLGTEHPRYESNRYLYK
jgi:hypothetical protein